MCGAPAAGIIERAGAEHSDEDVEQTVSDPAERARVAVPALAQGRIVRAAQRIDLRAHARPVIDGLPQASIASTAEADEAPAATGLPSAKEAARAYFARNGQPYSAKSVRAMRPNGYRTVQID